VEDAVRVRLPRLALVPVTNVFPIFGTIGPYLVLHEPGKGGRKGGVELPAVNSIGEVVYHPQAFIGGVATGPVSVVKLVAVQNKIKTV
jgi:hypothetical protein